MKARDYRHNGLESANSFVIADAGFNRYQRISNDGGTGVFRLAGGGNYRDLAD
jgi:hypothetical protein